MITEEEWQTFAKFDVPQPEQEALTAIVEGTREAIVVAPLEEGPAAAPERPPR